MASNGYVDRSAMGEAPLGSPPQGQKAGASFPGGMPIARSSANANPCITGGRLAALNATMPGGDRKVDVGRKMEDAINGGKY